MQHIGTISREQRLQMERRARREQRLQMERRARREAEIQEGTPRVKNSVVKSKKQYNRQDEKKLSQTLGIFILITIFAS